MKQVCYLAYSLIFWDLYTGSEKIYMLLFLVCLFFCLLTFSWFLIRGNCDYTGKREQLLPD